MAYINIETRLKRTWVERLFSLPWRPWQSHIVTVRREWRASYIAPNAETMAKIDRIIAERKAWKEKHTAAEQEAARQAFVAHHRRMHSSQPATNTTHVNDPMLMQHFPQASHYDTLARDDWMPKPDPITPGQGGDFGGGGASSSWSSDSSSCDTSSSSSYDSGGSCDSSSSSSD